MRVCQISDCDRKHYGRGYCQVHYTRVRSHGNPHTVKVGHRRQPEDPAARLNERSEWRGGCLVYTAGRPSKSGHRLMGYYGRSVGVHRIAYELNHGAIPDGLCVCHRCDVPSCINPEHLFLGTVADNNADRDRKGRHAPLRGSKNGHARLTEHLVIEMVRALNAGESQRAVARQFNVHQGTVHLIAAGKTWKHVDRTLAA